MTETTLTEAAVATVMIVDDTPASLGVVVESLEESGCRTVVAQDGEEALQRAMLVQPDLILLDVMMPKMDGIEVCQRLKNQAGTREIPVIFMTALAEPEHKLAGFRAGAVDYVTKPLQIEEVLARVGTHLKLRATQKRLEAKNAELQRYREELNVRVEERTAELHEEISYRKRAELKWLNESLRLQTLIQTIPDPVWLKSPQGVYLACNAALCRLYKASEAEIIGKMDRDLVDPDLAAFFRQKDQEAMAAGRPCVNEEWVTHLANGRQILFETIKTPLYDATGQLAGVLGVARDITEHKLLETELRAREQYQRALLDNFPFIVWLKDTESRFLAVNQPFAEAAGFESAEGFYGKSDLDIWPRDLAESYRADDGEVLRTGKKKTVEEYIAEHGLRKWFETYKAPVMVDGKLLGTVGFAREITERKRHDMLEKTRSRMFERLAQGASLTEVLGFLVGYVEKTHPDFICSIMLVDEGGRHLRSGPASPRLPQDYLDAIDGIQIGSDIGSCGAAAWSGETVIAEDVRTHPYWIPYRHLALQAGFLSCWSEPILDSRGKVLGTFGIYQAEPGRPSPDHLMTVDQATHLASIVIERKQAEEALHKREQEFRTLAENSPDVVARLDADCRYVYCNAQLESIVGLPREQILGRQPVEIRDNEAIRQFQAKVKEALVSGREAETIHVMGSSCGNRKIHDHVRFVPEFDQAGRAVSVLMIGRDISALKETERQLSTLVENIPDFVMRLDTDGRHLYVSPAVTDAFNLPPEHFIGKTAVDIALTGDRIGDRQMLDAGRKAASDGMPTMLTMTIAHKAGDRVFDILYVPEHDEFGNVISVLGVARDITSLQTAHHQLKKKEALLRSLIDSIPDLIFFKDTDSVYLGFNKAFSEYCGYSEAHMIGKTDYDFAPAEVADFYRHKDREMLASGTSRHNEEWITYPDGSRTLLDTLKTPLYDANGKVIGVIGISRDITQRKRMEQALIHREQEFRTMVEHSPDTVVRYDRDYRRVYVNHAYEALHGVRRQDVLGTTPLEFWRLSVPPQEYLGILRHIMKNGNEETLVCEIITPGGQAFESMRLVPEFGLDGSVESVLAISRDISELIATERRLETSRAQLRDMTARREGAREEERKHIAREIHDELGQLLSVLRLNVSMLDYRYGDDNADFRGKARNMTDILDQAIDRVRNLVTQLRPAVLSSGIAPALEWLAQEFSGNTGIRCRLDMTESDICFDEDRSMLVFRIVQESLTNVLRHSGADQVEISLRVHEGKLIVSVRDNGKGFVPGKVGRKNSFGILGMQERMLMLDGELEITSAPGQGTRLHLCIPIDAVSGEPG